MKNLTPKQAGMIRAALLRHDGLSIHPELNHDQANELTAALDALRLILMDIADGEGGKKESPAATGLNKKNRVKLK